MIDKSNKPIDRLIHSVKRTKRIRYIANLVKLSIFYNIENMHVKLSRDCVRRLQK